MNTGKIIKDIRTSRNMTQPQLAEKSGISLTSIKKYERGIVTPKLEQLLRISEALCISINIFLDFDIRTISDLLSLIFRMNEQVDMEITADKDKDGKYLPDTVRLSFAYDTINQKLCSYLTAQDKQTELHSDTNNPITAEGIEMKNLSDLITLLLDDNTVLQSSTRTQNSSTHAASHTPDSPFSTSSELHELFLDCTPTEAQLLIENAKLLKKYIRQMDSKK